MNKVLILSTALALTAPARASETAAPQVVRPSVLPARSVGTVAVTGVGRVQAVPNVATLTLSFTDTKNVPSKASQLDAQLRDQNLSALRQTHADRVAPILAEIRGLVSEKPRVQQRDVKSEQHTQALVDYMDGSNRSVFKGHSITTTIQITLRGSKASIERRLAQLFDSSRIKPDQQPEAVYSLSDSRRRAAERRALKLAIKDARSQAEAQLLPGEQLGDAVERGNRADYVPSPRPHRAMRAMASMESAGGGASGADIIAIGAESVEKWTSVVFQVLRSAIGLPTPVGGGGPL